MSLDQEAPGARHAVQYSRVLIIICNHERAMRPAELSATFPKALLPRQVWLGAWSLYFESNRAAVEVVFKDYVTESSTSGSEADLPQINDLHHHVLLIL